MGVTRRPDDGVIDSAAINRAIQGQHVALTAKEAAVAVLKLERTRGWGLDRIAQHMGYSRSRVNQIMNAAKARAPK